MSTHFFPLLWLILDEIPSGSNDAHLSTQSLSLHLSPSKRLFTNTISVPRDWMQLKRQYFRFFALLGFPFLDWFHKSVGAWRYACLVMDAQILDKVFPLFFFLRKELDYYASDSWDVHSLSLIGICWLCHQMFCLFPTPPPPSSYCSRFTESVIWYVCLSHR